ncbi:MAG: hypothetical protein HDQ88_00665 [Clostridia bacterium]|nr:hypothetical protein [Clostridia bacterium]
MGRYKYDKFLMQFSLETRKAIAKELAEYHGVNRDDYDWCNIDIRVKKADHAQRHRFKETLEKLQNYMTSDVVLYDMDGNACTFPVSSFQDEKRDVTVGQFSKITGRNRKTVEDWVRKGLIVWFDPGIGPRKIDIEATIEEICKKL